MKSRTSQLIIVSLDQSFRIDIVSAVFAKEQGSGIGGVPRILTLEIKLNII